MTTELNYFIRIEDPDAPIYRIFSLPHFEAALRDRQLTLVPPTLWSDPFESAPSFLVVEDPDQQPWAQIGLAETVVPIYAQCWSSVRESDALLRIYSRVEIDPHSRRNRYASLEGVRVMTTPRRLIQAIQAAFRGSDAFFIGAVQYDTPEACLQFLANTLYEMGPGAWARGRSRAKLALTKRATFEHEHEVRLIYVDDNRAGQDFVRIPFEPTGLFHEVTFDPRLDAKERHERHERIRALGYTGKIIESDHLIGAVTFVRIRGYRKRYG